MLTTKEAIELVRTMDVQEAARRLPEILAVVAVEADDMLACAEVLQQRVEASEAWEDLLLVFCWSPKVLRGSGRGATPEQVARACELLTEGFEKYQRTGSLRRLRC